MHAREEVASDLLQPPEGLTERRRARGRQWVQGESREDQEEKKRGEEV